MAQVPSLESAFSELVDRVGQLFVLDQMAVALGVQLVRDQRVDGEHLGTYALGIDGGESPVGDDCVAALFLDRPASLHCCPIDP